MPLYKGQCHCGSVSFEVNIDDLNKSIKCNCSVCVASRFWEIHVHPSAFTFIGSSKENLTTYQYSYKTVSHNFCKVCGTRVVIWGEIADKGPFYGVNIICLGLSPEELSKINVSYLDGINDRWDREPTFTNYL
eukprot:gene2728-3386_t